MIKYGERISHRGVPIDIHSDNSALLVATRLIGEGRPHQIITLTPQMYVEARGNPYFNGVLEQSLVVQESTGLDLYSRVFGPPLGKITGGVYLAKEIVSWCSENEKRIALVGSSEQNRNLAQQSLAAEFPGVRVDTVRGEYDFNNQTDSLYVMQKLDTIAANFVIFAGQEVAADTWINRNIILEDIGSGLIGNFGMTIDKEAGQVWMPSERVHRLGISWLLLMAKRNPKRRQEYIASLVGLAELGVRDLTHSLQGQRSGNLRYK